MSDLDKLRQEVEQSYNAVPYESFPFPQTHPTQLFSLAKLFHLNSTPIEKARILELGCAAGGNIIPIAYHFPTAEVMGIDLSKNQIDAGIKQVIDLGLNNITLKHQSILDFPKDAGLFDYIITHGVYSWVDKEIQHKILQICQDHLTPNGVAYISYNTLPGWNMAKNVRDLMQWHTKNITDPATKVQQARSILKFLTDGLKEDQSPYATFLRSEIELLSRQSDHYLLHEHLEHVNDPMYFHQFIGMANEHKLAYLCDTNLSLMYRENMVPAFSQELSKINDSVVMGQYMDFMRNQRFRCTLLCHQTATVDRKVDTTEVEGYSLQLTAHCTVPNFNEESIGQGKDVSFTQGSLTYTVRHTLSQMAMLILFENQTKPMAYADLCQALMTRAHIQNLDVVKQHLNQELNLMRLAFAGIVHLSNYGDNYTTELSEKPCACPLARYQAAHNRYVANRRHQPIMLDPLSKILIPLLDGTRDINALIEIINEHVTAGTLSVMDKDKQIVIDPAKRVELVKMNCQAFLQNLTRQALLITPDKHTTKSIRAKETEAVQ